jgi:hypothetical protein
MARRPVHLRMNLAGQEWMTTGRVWFVNPLGLKCYHRVDGPAIERYDGTKQWWRNGIMLGEETDWNEGQRHETEYGLRQRIKDLEQRIMELEEKLSLDAGTGV